MTNIKISPDQQPTVFGALAQRPRDYSSNVRAHLTLADGRIIETTFPVNFQSDRKQVEYFLQRFHQTYGAKPVASLKNDSGTNQETGIARRPWPRNYNLQVAVPLGGPGSSSVVQFQEPLKDGISSNRFSQLIEHGERSKEVVAQALSKSDQTGPVHGNVLCLRNGKCIPLNQSTGGNGHGNLRTSSSSSELSPILVAPKYNQELTRTLVVGQPLLARILRIKPKYNY